MDFALTDEQELLLESVREFCDRYFTDDVVKEMYENGGMPDEIARGISRRWLWPDGVFLRSTAESRLTKSRWA